MQFQTIISAKILVKYLDSPEWIILDCRGGVKNNSLSYAKYIESHIPNAYYCNLENKKEPTLNNVLNSIEMSCSLDETSIVLNDLDRAGINRESQFIIYDDHSGPLMDSLWLKFRTLGFQNVAVLQGGFSSWVEQKMPLADTSGDGFTHDNSAEIH